MESRRASASISAILLAFRRSPEIPAKSTRLLCFEKPLCRYEPANKFSIFTYRTIAIFAIYVSHLPFINYAFVIYMSHLPFENHTFWNLRFIYHTFDLRTRFVVSKFQ